ncbi:MAG: dicarboxylate/amino acid:cation symporter [Alphaproteobacteria bacterium]|nr:dicarboxylate/amino acid:cation symporter [Alphaproteobacteria bacterium]
MSESRSSEFTLTVLIIGAMVLAIPVGLAAHSSEAIAELVPWVSWLGVLFKQLLLLIIYPLVLASMVVGVVNLGDIRKVGGLAIKGLIYFTVTTAIAVVIGLVMVNAFRPGDGVDLAIAGAVPERVMEGQTWGTFFLDMLKNTFKNPFASLSEGDVLAIIAFGLLLGAVISTMGEEGRPLSSFFDALNRVMMRLTDWVMWLAPAGVFALLVQVVASQGVDALTAVGRYVLVVLAGLLLHGLVVLPLLGWLVGGVPPWRFFSGVRNAVAIAFSTASSAATLPVTMESVENNLDVDPKVSGFVLPLGATINMDGTALYESVAAMFIAQAYGIELDLGQQVLVFITATTAAVGAAGIPGAGVITMSLVLKAVGLPLEGIGLILAVDRILDMVRTTVNVVGDATGAVILHRITRQG